VDVSGKGQPNLHYRLCKLAASAPSHKDQEAMGGVFYAVAVATLNDADPDELAGSIKYVDGRHDHTTGRQRIRDISDGGRAQKQRGLAARRRDTSLAAQRHCRPTTKAKSYYLLSRKAG
jgi:hypothetical protein